MVVEIHISVRKTMDASTPSAQHMPKIFSTPENSEFYSKFTYTDLDPAQREIRLVHVSTTGDQGLISCRFHTHRLEEVKGGYYALSYFAGSPHDSRRILVEGVPFNIFTNLEYALRQALSLRRQSLPLLWIDQICIDQHNDDERSHQVDLMRDIYSHCKETIVSLRPADRDPLMPGAGEKSEVSSAVAWMNKLCWEFGRFRTASLTDMAIQKTLLNKLYDGKFIQGWLSFYDLLELPWWRRAWVQQEFICSPAVLFMHGDESIRWSRVSRFLPALLHTLRDISLLEDMFDVLISLLQNNFDPDWRMMSRTLRQVSELEMGCLRRVLRRGRSAMSALAGVETLVRIRQTWRGDEDLKKMLSLSKHCHSSDPRDRVFAFLGLANREYAISADYSSSNTLEHVLVSTARRIVEFDGHLGLLTYATGWRGGEDGEGAARLPSWVPDWTADSAAQGLGGFVLLPGQFPRPLPDSVRPFVTIEYPGGSPKALLRVVGHMVDSIHRGLPIWVNNARYGAFRTLKGYCIRSEGLCKQGDEVWCLIGAECLHVLRPMGDEGSYILVGCAEEISVEYQPADRMNLESIMEGMMSGNTRLKTVHIL